jgi:hypothetical protein
MRISTTPNLPRSDDVPSLKRRLSDLLRDIAQQINGISEGSITARHNALTAAPVLGKWQRGDFVPNKEPAEAGSVGSKYVITGWICVTSGEPGTWLECRSLTGG